MNDNTFGESRTFRGASLEELLPKIRAELGSDAVILREREGVVGGVGGFFGRRCVEVEAAPTWPLLDDDVVPSVPAHDAAILYQSDPPELVPPENRFMEALLDRAAALDELFVPAQAGDVPAMSEAAFEPLLLLPEPAAAPSPLREEYHVRLALAETGMSASAIDEVMRRAVAHLRPLAPGLPLRDLVRRAFRETVATPVGWTGRRAIAFAGSSGTDAVAVVGALARPFAAAGARVAVVALGGGRDAARAGSELGAAPAELLVAHDAREAEQAARRALDADLVLAVAPRASETDPRSQLVRAGLLIAFAADENHLVMDAGLGADVARREHDLLDAHVAVGGLVPVGLELETRVGGVLGLAVDRRLGIRWIASGETPTTVTTADPSSLAGACLR